MRYTVVIEQAGTGFSAYVPDLPGCIATGRTHLLVKQGIAEAMKFHLDGLRDDGATAPNPTARAYVVAPRNAAPHKRPMKLPVRPDR